MEVLAASLRRVLATPETASMMGRWGLERIQTWSFEKDIQALRQALAQLTRKIVA
jgi:hypothetical protein